MAARLLSAGLAHELNNPVSAIEHSASLLMERPADAGAPGQPQRRRDRPGVAAGADKVPRVPAARRHRWNWRTIVNKPVLLAAGDIRAGAMNRVASAVGEGSMVVRLVHEYLALN